MVIERIGCGNYESFSNASFGCNSISAILPARNAASHAITVLHRWFSAETAASFTGAFTGTTTAANPSSGAASVSLSLLALNVTPEPSMS